MQGHMLKLTVQPVEAQGSAACGEGVVVGVQDRGAVDARQQH